MRISIEVGHPAHVHYWRNVIQLLSSRGHEISVLARKKEITLHLLNAYGIPFDIVGESRPDMISKGLGVLLDDLRVLRSARRKGIELMLSTGIPGSAHASRILGVPHVALIDTEIATLGRLLTEPFSDMICTPACFRGKIPPEKHVRFDGYLELMYLHPRYFRPNQSVLATVGLAPGDPFAIVRFSSANSSHDLPSGSQVLKSDSDRFRLVAELARRLRVFITSESELPAELAKFRLVLPPERFHDLLSFASLYAGDGAKVASEAGVLGVPWIYLSASRRGYLDDQEMRFASGTTVDSIDRALILADEWAFESGLNERSRRRERLLAETCDVTRFMVELVDGWSEGQLGLLSGVPTSAGGKHR